MMTDWKPKLSRYTAGGDARRFARKVEDRIYRSIGGRTSGFMYDGRVADEHTAATLLRDALVRSSPQAISRLGANEQRVLFSYQSRLAGGKDYSSDVRHDISAQAGVHPNDSSTLDKFAELYLSCIPNLDMLGVWFHRAERLLVKRVVGLDANLVPLRCFDPLATQPNWAASLSGRRVCVVHPFAKSIEAQYARRREIFSDERYLPDFDLQVVRAVQGIGGLSEDFSSWFDALDSMSEAMAKTRADIVLIGAGAFGLPLAVRAKEAGMTGFHVGGGLQLMFGIIGRRWEGSESVSRLINEYWVRPLPEETPFASKAVENACYW